MKLLQSEPDEHDCRVISAEDNVSVIRLCQILNVRRTAWAGTGQIFSAEDGSGINYADFLQERRGKTSPMQTSAVMQLC